MDSVNSLPIHHSDQFYRHLFDASPDVMMLIDQEGVIQVMNSRCKEVLDYASSDLQGQPFQALLPDESRPAFAVMLTGVRDGTQMPEAEVSISSASGHDIPMMLDIRRIEESQADYFLFRLRDLREIKALEQEYRSLFESIADAVFIGDVDSGQIYQVNQQACKLTGYSLGEIIGGDYDSFHSESWLAVQQAVDESPSAGLDGRETRLVTKEGEEIPVETHLRIVPRGASQIYIESAIDIRDRMALEERMQELRSEWDSFIRHELRSPLTPILAFSQILMEDFEEIRTNEKVFHFIETIYQGGKRLERLLDLTREVSQYERGEILLQRIETNLYFTLNDAIQDAALGATEGAEEEKRVKLIPHDGAGESPDLQISHDSQKLQRAIANLVKNALEHDTGEVAVRVISEEDAVSVHVHNGGDPIAEDHLKTIFEKFNTTKREKKGTGLGTTIAKLFVEAHGGQIVANSSKEEGTTFSLSIPKSAGTEKEETK